MVKHIFRVLASLKGLRGTALDIFGKTEERKQERLLVEQYFSLVGKIIDNLNPENYATAVELASLPEQLRGYGHVKEKSIASVKSKEAQLLNIFNNPELRKSAAE